MSSRDLLLDLSISFSDVFLMLSPGAVCTLFCHSFSLHESQMSLYLYLS